MSPSLSPSTPNKQMPLIQIWWPISFSLVDHLIIPISLKKKKKITSSCKTQHPHLHITHQSRAENNRQTNNSTAEIIGINVYMLSCRDAERSFLN